MIGEVILAHLVGDYLLQSHWMATGKVERWWPAVVHGVTYTLPFLFITLNPWALAIICVTHIIIDRYRLAKHLSWLKNLMGPWPRVSTARPQTPGEKEHGVVRIRVYRDRLRWSEARENAGYPKDTPVWLSTWLMIITDNTVHILINLAAIILFGIS